MAARQQPSGNSAEIIVSATVSLRWGTEAQRETRFRQQDMLRNEKSVAETAHQTSCRDLLGRDDQSVRVHIAIFSDHFVHEGRVIGPNE